MKRLAILLGCLAILASTWALTALQAQEPPEIQKTVLTWKQVATGDGAQLYTELCASCHGAAAAGDGPAAAELGTPVPDLTRLARDNDGVFPAERVRRTITGATAVTAHDVREMPEWGRRMEELRPDLKVSHREAITEMRIDTIVGYLDSVQMR